MSPALKLRTGSQPTNVAFAFSLSAPIPASCSFRTIPPEIRNKIWHYTLSLLPYGTEKALYFWQKGYWVPREVETDDEEYDPNMSEQYENPEFKHDLLDTPQFEMPPLAFVNSEARNFTLGWIHSQRLVISPVKNEQGKERSVLIHRFDPKRDALYVSVENFRRFKEEPLELIPGPYCGRIHGGVPDFRCLVLPERAVRTNLVHRVASSCFYFRAKMILVVPEIPLEILNEPGRLWEYRETGEGLIWDLETEQFSFKTGGGLIWDGEAMKYNLEKEGLPLDKSLSRAMERVGEGIFHLLVYFELDEFRIQQGM